METKGAFLRRVIKRTRPSEDEMLEMVVERFFPQHQPQAIIRAVNDLAVSATHIVKTFAAVGEALRKANEGK